MSRFVDLTGKKFEKLIVIERVSNDKHGNAMWKCICDCGNETVTSSTKLNRGKTKSCGCLNREAISRVKTTHGLSNNRIYIIWNDMIHRCYDSNDIRYSHYGGRGITVCDEWKNSVTAFYEWAMANGYRDDLTIDRVNNDGNYEPSNCRWATRKEQMNNTTRNHFLTYNDETHTIAEWAEIIGIDKKVLTNRIKAGWSVERAFTQSTVRKKHLITYNGETHSISEWAKITGLKSQTIKSRLFLYGWDADRALTEKVTKDSRPPQSP